MPHITISSDAVITWDGVQHPCALGPAGLCAAAQKREGDGATPMGAYLLRRILYRTDRVAPPRTTLPVRPLRPDDGWCDDPADPAYNRPVRLPWPGSTEALWRTDHIYDLLGIISHNDTPPAPGKGSAIFIHLARPGYTPTCGCVALNEKDLRALFAFVHKDTLIRIG